MNRWAYTTVALTIIALGAVLMLVLVPAPHPLQVADTTGTSTTPAGTASTSAPSGTSTTTPDLSDLIVVTSPKSGATIGSGTGTSTLTITGKARGSFYFEASFPVYLTDWDGKIIAQGHAQAQGDWMTSDFVPFSATLTFATPTAGDPSANRGTIVLHNDNPSGDPARDKALEIPVYFK